jgi:antitoxin component YwqK of YwqJK toxin-antitoxin module
LIVLNRDEHNILWDALATATNYYEEHNLKDEQKYTKDLLLLLTMANQITIKFYEDGSITKDGMDAVQRFMRSRKDQEEPKKKGKIICLR